MRYILGIETSCDETAVAVFDCEQKKMVSNQLFTQISLHQEFGGVMPEVASRSHVEKIGPVTNLALQEAGITFDQVNVVAVTTHPGLVGSLLVGVCFAKSVAYAKQAKLLSVNHNHGHIVSSFLDNNGNLRDDIVFPHLCLSVSGGHTSFYLVNSPTEFQLIGNTIDDAAGEAFDKVAKLMNLGYPGGPIIEKLASQAGFVDYFKFSRNKDKQSLDFSFSGLKTSVLYSLARQGFYDLAQKQATENLTPEVGEKVASSFLVCVRDIFFDKLAAALNVYPQIKAISMVGGVSCNRYLTGELEKFCQQHDKMFFFPPKKYTTDNGAMIALAAYYLVQTGTEFSDLDLDVKRF